MKTSFMCNGRTEGWFVGALVIFSTFAVEAQPLSPASKNQQDIQELSQFRLSMDKLTRLAQAFKAMERLTEKDLVTTGMDPTKQPDAGSIDATVTAIESQPKLRAAIRGTGLSSRECALMVFCCMKTAQVPIWTKSTLCSRTAIRSTAVNRDSIVGEGLQ